MTIQFKQAWLLSLFTKGASLLYRESVKHTLTTVTLANCNHVILLIVTIIYYSVIELMIHLVGLVLMLIKYVQQIISPFTRTVTHTLASLLFVILSVILYRIWRRGTWFDLQYLFNSRTPLHFTSALFSSYCIIIKQLVSADFSTP